MILLRLSQRPRWKATRLLKSARYRPRWGDFWESEVNFFRYQAEMVETNQCRGAPCANVLVLWSYALRWGCFGVNKVWDTHTGWEVDPFADERGRHMPELA